MLLASHAPNYGTVAISHILVTSWSSHTDLCSVHFWLRFQATFKSSGNFIYFRRASSTQDNPQILETTYTK